MSVYFECPVCGKQPKIGTYGVNIAWASCKGYAFHRHKKISVCIFPVDDDYFCAYGERPNCGADMRNAND